MNPFVQQYLQPNPYSPLRFAPRPQNPVFSYAQPNPYSPLRPAPQGGPSADSGSGFSSGAGPLGISKTVWLVAALAVGFYFYSKSK